MPEVISPNELIGADVILYRGEGWLSRAIQFFDGTEMSHASLYLGDGFVGEALGGGLQRRPLATSIGTGHPRVLARRMKQTPSTSAPVLAHAQGLLAEGHRYGYEQLLLLTFLALTRKLKVTPVLRTLLRKVLDSAASLVARLTAAGREPMICSEFVYRCYDEALPASDDEYTIEVNPYPSVVAPPVRGRAAAIPMRPRGKGIHSDSLLVHAASSTAITWRARPTRTAVAAAATGEIDQAGLDALIAVYLEEATGTGSRGRARKGSRSVAAAARTTDDDVRAAVLRFASVWMAVPGPVPVRGGAMAPAARGGVRPLDHLLSTAADFVTPGDLLHSESLLTVGDLPVTPSRAAARRRR